MGSYYDLKFYNHNSGTCQQCKFQNVTLYTAVLTVEEKSKQYILCKDCGLKLKKNVDKKNSECSVTLDTYAQTTELNSNYTGNNAPLYEPKYTYLMPSSDRGIICLKRKKAAYGCAAKYIVYIDDAVLGTMKNGDSLRCEVPVGCHNIVIFDKSYMKKPVYSNSVFVSEIGITGYYAADRKLKIDFETKSDRNGLIIPCESLKKSTVDNDKVNNSGKKCPKCGGLMQIQTVSEQKNTGCGTILFYILLAVTVLGILVLIPLLLRKKTETKTYAVCQRCGYKQIINSR